MWRIAGEGRGLLYAKRAMSVKPARRTVRSTAIVSEGGDILGRWAKSYALVFIMWGLVHQCAEEKIRG